MPTDDPKFTPAFNDLPVANNGQRREDRMTFEKTIFGQARVTRAFRVKCLMLSKMISACLW